MGVLAGSQTKGAPRSGTQPEVLLPGCGDLWSGCGRTHSDCRLLKNTHSQLQGLWLIKLRIHTRIHVYVQMDTLTPQIESVLCVCVVGFHLKLFLFLCLSFYTIVQLMWFLSICVCSRILYLWMDPVPCQTTTWACSVPCNRYVGLGDSEGPFYLRVVILRQQCSHKYNQQGVLKYRQHPFSTYNL